jgi:hypothetical protein
MVACNLHKSKNGDKWLWDWYSDVYRNRREIKLYKFVDKNRQCLDGSIWERISPKRKEIKGGDNSKRHLRITKMMALEKIAIWIEKS